MVVIFISHSKRDEKLVRATKEMLINIGHSPIIEEFIPEEQKEPIPYEEIRKNVNLSSCVFLFLTDNIVKTEYTKNWVMYEVGVASDARKRLIIFEREGMPIPYPIPYLTDYMLFDPNDTVNILNIQSLAKKIGEIPRGLITGGLGALAGLPFGPLGIILGGLGGAIVGSIGKEEMPKVTCQSCNISFNYLSPNIKSFSCPSCRRPIMYRGGD